MLPDYVADLEERLSHFYANFFRLKVIWNLSRNLSCLSMRALFRRHLLSNRSLNTTNVAIMEWTRINQDP